MSIPFDDVLSRPIRITLAIPNFERLGAQRVVIWLAQGFDRNRILPTVLVHNDSGPMRKLLPPDVPIVRTDDYCPHIPKFMSISRLIGYKRALAQCSPDIVVGITQAPTLYLAWAKRKMRAKWSIVACEHSYVSRNLQDPEAYSRLFRMYYRKYFPNVYNNEADRVVVLTEAARDDLVQNFLINPAKIVTIANPIDIKTIQEQARTQPTKLFGDSNVQIILGVGRLVWQKGFNFLIDAFSKIAQDMKQFRLVILGEGPERPTLEKLILEQGLSNLVKMPGAVDNVWSYMAQASLLVMTSRWEGLPMVLLEAAALKLPIVSFDCPSGPSEILQNGRGGKLVKMGDTVELARAIKDALVNVASTEQRAEVAYQTALEHDIRKICSQYAAMFETLVL